MAVTVGPPAAGGSFPFGSTPERLFAIPSSGNTERFTYQPAQDGRRFLVTLPLAGSGLPIAVVLNWTAALGR